jgi:hypothetical protein
MTNPLQFFVKYVMADTVCMAHLAVPQLCVHFNVQLLPSSMVILIVCCCVQLAHMLCDKFDRFESCWKLVVSHLYLPMTECSSYSVLLVPWFTSVTIKSAIW